MIFLILFVLLALGGVAAFLIYYRYRRLLREAKNYERGLKMVSLLIHLPPGSDDLDIGTRDARDVTEETISKAQVLYNIIASTATKGFKSKFYGQRHIAFEIVATKGLIHYYAAVPVAMVSVVRQAVVSAYPSASLEEVEEHNIFSPVGKISGTIGGELVLKEHFAHPIATFSDSKRDAMQSILNSFSSLTTEDGAAIQLLMRPAKEGWTKNALQVAADIREEKETKKKGNTGIGKWFFEVLGALWKAPDPGEKTEDGTSKKPLTALEQSNIDAIEEKTRHPGYETLVRIVASSNTSNRSQALLNNMVASFALFDAPGKNGFKFIPAKDIERFVTAYIFRFFPPEINSVVLNSVELATIFHLPEQRSTPTQQLNRQQSKQVDGPNNVSEEGLLLGYNIFRGVKKEIRLSQEDRRRHLYVVGQTGTGKSVFLENLALQDMLDGRGFAFIDPHGDAVEKLVSLVPKERTEDIVYFSPADMDYPLGLNLFEFSSPEQKDFLIQEAINMLYKLYDPQHTGIIGPRYEHWFRNAALTLMSDPSGSTFIEIPKIFTDNQYARAKQKYVTDPTVLDFWNKEMAKTTDYHKSEILGWFVSKFGAFMSNEMMRNIIGQPKSSFDLRKIMDERKILLVNLSKGRTGELNSKLLGMIFVMKFQAAAMSRANLPEDQRPDFSLYVDEFQNFSTDSFATILSEARKYHLNLIVANQFISQLSEDIRDAVFGNVGSVITLRTGANDADFLVKQFAPIFDSEDLVKLPNYNAVVRLMIGGVPSQPFSMATIPPLGHPSPQLGTAIKKLSAAKHGRPRAAVEKEIFERLQTKALPVGGAKGALPPGNKFGPGTAAGLGSGGPPKQSAKSFLDEWLEKRKKSQSQAAPKLPGPSAAPPPASPWKSPASRAPATGQAWPATPPPARPVMPPTPPIARPPAAPIAPIQAPTAASSPGAALQPPVAQQPISMPAPASNAPLPAATPPPIQAAPPPPTAVPSSAFQQANPAPALRPPVMPSPQPPQAQVVSQPPAPTVPLVPVQDQPPTPPPAAPSAQEGSVRRVIEPLSHDSPPMQPTTTDKAQVNEQSATVPDMPAGTSSIIMPSAFGTPPNTTDQRDQGAVQEPEFGAGIVDEDDEDEVIPVGPTAFASQMADLKEEMETRKSSLASAQKDKADVASIANVVKEQIHRKSQIETEPVNVAPKPSSSVSSADMSDILPGGKGEIYIDKDGQIHYGKDAASELGAVTDNEPEVVNDAQSDKPAEDAEKANASDGASKAEKPASDVDEPPEEIKSTNGQSVKEPETSEEETKSDQKKPEPVKSDTEEAKSHKPTIAASTPEDSHDKQEKSAEDDVAKQPDEASDDEDESSDSDGNSSSGDHEEETASAEPGKEDTTAEAETADDEPTSDNSPAEVVPDNQTAESDDSASEDDESTEQEPKDDPPSSPKAEDQSETDTPREDPPKSEEHAETKAAETSASSEVNDQEPKAEADTETEPAPDDSKPSSPKKTAETKFKPLHKSTKKLPSKPKPSKSSDDEKS